MIQWYGYTSGYNTKLHQTGYNLANFLKLYKTHILQNIWLEFLQIGMELMFSEIYPGSMSYSNIIEKSLM